MHNKRIVNTENKQANELKIKKTKHIIEQIIKRTKQKHNHWVKKKRKKKHCL